jgi:hypothetical protein
MGFATLTPLPGVSHTPQTQAGPWAFPFEGQWHTITDEAGRPRPLDLSAARAAEAFFTQRPPDGEPVCLVQVQLHEGEQQYRLPQQTSFTDPETGEAFDSMEELVQTIKARALAGATGPESRVPGAKSDEIRGETGKGGK